METEENEGGDEMKPSELYVIVILAFGLGGIIGCYLTHTTVNAWVSFFWLCFGFVLYAVVINPAYEIIMKFIKEKGKMNKQNGGKHE